MTWAAGSEELMVTFNVPAPGAVPRPCTTMLAVAFDGSCWVVQRTAVVPPALLMTSQLTPPEGVTWPVSCNWPPKLT